MPTTDAKPLEPGESLPANSEKITENRNVIAWSSFSLALLQSICGAIVTIDGLRLAIGIGALSLTTGVGAAMVRFHTDAIRIPMLAIALFGSLLNLAILLHVRHLRNRPASQWRQKPLTPHQKRMERVQMVLSLATLVLIGVEEYLHLALHHTL